MKKLILFSLSFLSLGISFLTFPLTPEEKAENIKLLAELKNIEQELNSPKFQEMITKHNTLYDKLREAERRILQEHGAFDFEKVFEDEVFQALVPLLKKRGIEAKDLYSIPTDQRDYLFSQLDKAVLDDLSKKERELMIKRTEQHNKLVQASPEYTAIVDEIHALSPLEDENAALRKKYYEIFGKIHEKFNTIRAQNPDAPLVKAIDQILNTRDKVLQQTPHAYDRTVWEQNYNTVNGQLNELMRRILRGEE